MAGPTGKEPPVELEVGGRVVRLSSPGREYFPAATGSGLTKLDVARYYLAVGDGIVRALRDRPCMLHRYPKGVSGPKVHQKRLPAGAPPWVRTVRVHFPRYDRWADELCVGELAEVIWAVQMSTVEFHPWNSRRADTERPDEWRIDLDPMPRCDFATVRRVAGVVHEVLAEIGAVGWPKTSGGSGLHVYVRIQPRWGFTDVRRAALAFAREVGRRTPEVTTTWWRKDRDPRAVFVDYNQNARDHTIACAYSIRGVPEATVSTPIRWDEVADVEPQALTVRTVPARYAELGDLHAGIDGDPRSGDLGIGDLGAGDLGAGGPPARRGFSLEPLLEWADRDERDHPEAGPPPAVPPGGPQDRQGPG
jgi:DNA ligase D